MKKLLISTILAAAAAFSFTGCYDAIFQSIRNEVELEDGTISGFDNSIVRYDSGSNKYLFTSNGAIYYKDASKSEHGAWEKVSGNGLPSTITYSYWTSEFSGLHYYKMAADSTYVYVLGYEMEYDEDNSRNVPSKIELYYCKPVSTENEDGSHGLDFSSGWQRSSLSDEINAYLEDLKDLDDDNYSMDSSVHLFCTNAYNNGHRYAYLRIAGGSPYVSSSRNSSWDVYELDGGSSSNIKSCTYENSTYTYTTDGSSAVVTDTEKVEITRYTLSAVYFDGKVHFTNYLNTETNEGTTAASETPTYVYYGNGTSLFSFAVGDYSSVTTNIYKDQTVTTYAGTEKTESVSAIMAYNCGLYSLVATTDDDGTVSYSRSIVQPDTLVSSGMGTTASIISLAVTNDSIILGTGYNRSYSSSSGSGYGAFRVELTNGVPATETSDFSTNADTVMCNPYHVRALLCATPSKSETEADIYSTMDYIYTESSSGTSISNRGLWAYYPSRGNWNRE